MYIGLGIVLLVVGAIFSFDVITIDIPHINQHPLGVILMVGGVLAILLSLLVTDRYRTQRVVREAPVVEERRIR